MKLPWEPPFSGGGPPPSLTLKAAALRAEGWLCGGRGRGPGPGSGAGRSVAEAAVSFGHHDRVGSGWERTGPDRTGLVRVWDRGSALPSSQDCPETCAASPACSWVINGL